MVAIVLSFLCLITPLHSYLYGGLYGGLYEGAHMIRHLPHLERHDVDQHREADRPGGRRQGTEHACAEPRAGTVKDEHMRRPWVCRVPQHIFMRLEDMAPTRGARPPPAGPPWSAHRTCRG